MKTCYIMVGLPASGKSTFIRKLQDADPDSYVYSTDGILERIAVELDKTYDDVFTDHISTALTESEFFLNAAIKLNLNVIWDQTNLGVKKRRGIIDRMSRKGYRIECIAFRMPISIEENEEWDIRLHSRKGKTIPKNIINNMTKSYIEPTLDEGFASLTIMNIYGKVV